MFLTYHRSSLKLSAAVSCIALTALLLCAGPSPGAGEQLYSNSGALLEKYAEIKAKLERNQFGLPISLESEVKGDLLRSEVYGIINYPLKKIENALQFPVEWCNITTLHLNIKGCTYRGEGNNYQLTLYSGSKHYQAPENAHKQDFRFLVVANTPVYLNITLVADKGPYFTRDYRIGLEAVALSRNKTFIHFISSNQYGKPLQILVRTYFATAGRDKVGFSIITTEDNGKPVYVKGVRGALERNAVRYYLALLADIDTMNYPAASRFDKRINEWFALTERYPRQLHELDREEYLAVKKREHSDQLKLQEGLESK